MDGADEAPRRPNNRGPCRFGGQSRHRGFARGPGEVHNAMAKLPRRGFLTCAVGFGLQGMVARPHPAGGGTVSMTRFGLFGKLTAHPGQRDALVQILLAAAELVAKAPGCEVYIVHTSPTEPETVWVTEVWSSEADHDASLAIDGVRELITKARPLIELAPEGIRTIPVGGKGLTIP